MNIGMSFGSWIERRSAWIGLVGAVVGVLGFIYGIEAAPSGSVAYRQKTISLVQSAGLNSSLSISDRNGRRLLKNVYATEIVIWNSGDYSLGNASDRVRDAVRLSLDNASAEIVDYSVQKSTLANDLIHLSQLRAII